MSANIAKVTRIFLASKSHSLQISQGKSLLFLRYLRYLRTFRGPSCLEPLLSVESCHICYSCDFCDICNEWFLLARKILVTFAIFAIFADISGPFLPSSSPKS